MSKLGEEVGEAVGQRAGVAPGLLRPPRCAAGDVDEHNRQAAGAERIGQRAAARHHIGQGVDGGGVDEAALQVDDDEGGVRIECGQRHGVLS